MIFAFMKHVLEHELEYDLCIGDEVGLFLNPFGRHGYLLK